MSDTHSTLPSSTSDSIPPAASHLSEQSFDTDIRLGHDVEKYWVNTKECYPHYPTVRHRKRYIFNQVANFFKNRSRDDVFIFDYGCGEATVIDEIKRLYGLRPDQVGGLDVSKEAVATAKIKTGSPYFYDRTSRLLDRKISLIICSEVVEHTPDYEKVLDWMFENLETGGVLILTTQTGRIHASDVYTGHTQHFAINALQAMVKHSGFSIVQARLWGFPFFTIQKYLTNICFDFIQKIYLEGTMTIQKRITFGLTYNLNYIHELIPFGPQIYIVAKKDSRQ